MVPTWFPKDILGSETAFGAAKARRIGAPMEYVLDPEKRVVWVKCRGKVTFGDIEEYSALLRANPLFEADFSEVVDMSEIEELDLTAEEFLRLADEIIPFSVEARRAFVVRNEAQHHTARLHKILGAQTNFLICRSIEEARRWVEA